jgi:hypothetical protein
VDLSQAVPQRQVVALVIEAHNSSPVFPKYPSAFGRLNLPQPNQGLCQRSHVIFSQVYTRGMGPLADPWLGALRLGLVRVSYLQKTREPQRGVGRRR